MLETACHDLVDIVEYNYWNVNNIISLFHGYGVHDDAGIISLWSAVIAVRMDLGYTVKEYSRDNVWRLNNLLFGQERILNCLVIVKSHAFLKFILNVV